MKRTPLTRKKPMPRATLQRPPAGLSGPKAPRKPLPKKNAARAQQAFGRAYGSEDRVKWMRSQPCVVCGGRPCENAHVKNGGMGRKADARFIVPLCHVCHQKVHEAGQQTFEMLYNMDLTLWSQIIDARWEQFLATRKSP